MRTLLSSIKTLIMRLAIFLVRIVPFVPSVNIIQSALELFAFTPLRFPVYKYWSKFLINSGHRIKALEWSETFRKRCENNFGSKSRLHFFSLSLVLDNLRLGNLDCGELLNQTRDQIYEISDDKNYKFLQVVEAIYAIEKTQKLGQSKHAISGDKKAREYFQYRMERAHAIRNEPAVAVYAQSLAASVSYSPELVTRFCERVLEVNNLHQTALTVLDIALDKVEYNDRELLKVAGQNTDTIRGINTLLQLFQDRWKQEENPQDHSANLQYRKAHHLLELKRYDEVEELIQLNLNDERFKSIRAKKLQLTNELASSEAALSKIIDGVNSLSVKSDRLGELAEVCEEQRKFDDAITLYRASHHTADKDSLNIARSASWRYVSALMSLNLWTEANAVLRETQVYMWQFFKAFLPGSSPYSKIEKNDFRLPEDGGLILGCWGIGDELFRMGIWNQLANKDARWALTCEPRLESVFKRSFPDMEVIVSSRVNGPNAVSEYEYWEEREGLPANTDFGRVTRSSLAAMKRHKNVLISEMFLYEFVSRDGKIDNPALAPTLTVDENEMTRVQSWLATLPEGINVAVSWRSGQQSSTRDKNYTQLNEWGEILSLPGVNFINLQYSDLEEEKDEVRRLFNANIFDMPGVNRKHDIETILAICKSCDLVIAPCTAVREMAGSIGAETWSLTTTPYLPDLWRIGDDGKTDKFYSNMTHFTSQEHGSKFGVLKAIAGKLEERLAEKAPEPVTANAN